MSSHLEKLFDTLDSDEDSAAEVHLGKKTDLPPGNVDPIAVAACLHREATNVDRYGLSVWDSSAVLRITDADVLSAGMIRSYYKNRFTMLGLLHKGLTAFQRDIYAYLLGDIEFYENLVGAVLRLPYFYIEDNERDLLKWQTPFIMHPRQDWEDLWQATVALKFLKSIYVVRRHGQHRIEYWFECQGEFQGRPVRLSVPKMQWISVFDSLTRFPLMTVSARLIKRVHSRLNHVYYDMSPSFEIRDVQH